MAPPSSALYAVVLLGHAVSTHATQSQCSPDSILPPLLRLNRVCYPAIDDNTNDPLSRAGTDNSPWTEAPYCLYPRSIGSKQKFCVYSSSVFNDNAGISIITTPEAAASLAEAVGDPLPAWRNKAHLARGGELTPEQEAPLAYKIVSMPGKGKGVVATRHIAQFDSIMVSFPAMFVDNEFLPREQEEQPVESWRLFQRALHQLTDKKRFVQLAATGRGEDVHIVEDVVRTNAFGLTVLDRDLKGLYPEIARLNHGCDPNAFPQYKSRDMSMTAVATRDIQPGEEITISYLPLGMPTRHRLRSLGNWGFNCTCTLCSSPPEVRQASDRRREKLADLYFAMKEPTITHKKLLALTDEFLELVHAERLQTRFGEYFQALIRFYYDFGDYGNALKYAELSLKYSEAFSDPEGGFCSSLRQDIAFLKDLIRERGGKGK